MNSLFDGQQTDEIVLHVIEPHPMTHTLALVKVVILTVLFFMMLMAISLGIPIVAGIFRTLGLIVGVSVAAIGVWWTNTIFRKDKTYLTDRRIIRFETVSPFFQAKRSLFWKEVLKVKAYTPNLMSRLFKIGNIDIAPQLAETESIHITHAYYFEDLANYIDKILFIVQNNPSEIQSIKPFVAKPKGQRE
jgi:hypothetical protein